MQSTSTKDQSNLEWFLTSHMGPLISQRLTLSEESRLSATCSNLRGFFLNKLGNNPQERSSFISHLMQQNLNDRRLVEVFRALNLQDQPISFEATSSTIKTAKAVVPFIPRAHGPFFPHVEKLTYVFECPKIRKRHVVGSVFQTACSEFLPVGCLKTAAHSAMKKDRTVDKVINSFNEKRVLNELNVQQSFVKDTELNALMAKISKCDQLEIIITSASENLKYDSLFFPVKEMKGTQINQLIVKSDHPIIYGNSFKKLGVESLCFDHPWLRNPDNSHDTSVAESMSDCRPSLLPSLPESLIHLSIVDCSPEQLEEISIQCPQLKELELREVVSLNISKIFKAFPNLEFLYIQESKNRKCRLDYENLGSSEVVKTIEIEAKNPVENDILGAISQRCPNAKIIVK